MKSIERSSASSTSVLIQLILFFCYLIFGALVFQALELENETRERQTLLNSRRDLQKKYNVTEEDLKRFIKLVQAIADQGFSDEWVDRWNFIGALFFSGTVVTTIGESQYTLCLNLIFSLRAPSSKGCKVVYYLGVHAASSEQSHYLFLQCTPCHPLEVEHGLHGKN